MKNVWNVTGDLSNALDIEHSRLYFCPPPVLPQVIAFEFWGVILYTTAKFWHPELRVHGADFDATREDVFIAGISRLSISEPECGDFHVALYDPGGKKFVKTAAGEDVCLIREWPGEKSDDAFEYGEGGFLDWPRGDCNVTVFSRGKATFEFDSNDCVSYREYLENPDKYEPPEHGPFITV